MSGDGGDSHAASPRMTSVSDLRDAAFQQLHMECLRLFVALWRLHEQREWIRNHSDQETDDERDDRHEFEIELTNLHALLTNRHVDSIDVLRTARTSIEQYLALWPGAADAIDRWWAPRQDTHAAVHADLQLVIPSLWIGSKTTLQPPHASLLDHRRIRHVVHCVASAVDCDDDFHHGAARARELQRTRAFPTIEVFAPEDSDSDSIADKPPRVRPQHHRITLSQLGHMEFLVRRREHTLPVASSSTAIHKVCRYVQKLLRDLRTEQYARECTTAPCGLVDQLDSVLLYCDSGTEASIVVAVALLMAELGISYDVALRLVTCARAYVTPSSFFEHVLHAYDSTLCDAQATPFSKFELC